MNELELVVIPVEVARLARRPPLLPGEHAGDFEVLQQMILTDIRPETNIEWLWALDLIELSWEILRYRGLKQRTLEMARVAAIEALLRRADNSGVSADADETAQIYSRLNALEWRDDADAAVEIETRLQRLGFDSIALNAEVYLQAQGQLELFDQLTHRAQQRRMILLREMSIRRELVVRARRITGVVADASLSPNMRAGSEYQITTQRRFSASDG